MRDLVIKKCLKCGATVEIIEDCNCENCGIKCCGEKMVILNPNSADAAFEKHVPNYEIIDDKIVVSVNHVMEEEHYIEWIALVSDTISEKIFFKPGDKATATFSYKKESKLYAYCNKHGLWVKEVE